MSSWLSASPEILFALAILAVPGLILALCLRFRPWDVVGLSVPLSLGVLALANEAASHAKIQWGLPVIAGTTAFLAVVCIVWVVLGSRLARGRAAVDRRGERVVDAAAWTRLHHQIAIAATLGAAVVGAIAVARGIGTPHSLNQTFDGAFHVNSISAVARQHSAATSVFGGVTDPGLPSGFYPPTFGAVGGLLVIYTGINPIVAANIMALAIALLWPLTVSIAVRRLARPSAFGYSIAMVGAVTVALFPALLLRFGTLWPNALSYLALAPALVVLIRLFGLDQAEADAEDPQVRMPWWPTLLAAAIAIPGLALAHPGAVYLVFYLAMPALLWLGWRWLVVRSARGPAAKTVGAVGTVAVVGVLFVGVVWASSRVAAIASVRHQYWPPVEKWDQAVGEVLLLGSHLSSPNAAMAILAVAGIVVALRSASGRYLAACYLIIAAMCVTAAAVQTRTTMRWTGFWYNDPYRLFAALPVIVLPLVALGADACRDQLRMRVERVIDSGALRWPTKHLTVGVASGLVLCLGILVFQGGLGTRKISTVVAASYAHAPHLLVNPAESAMFARLGKQARPGVAIAGDPFTGEILAGVLSGHPIVYSGFGRPKVPDRELVAAKFNRYRTDPAVCAAVKRLRIGIVVTGRHYFMETPTRRSWFAGFNNMASIPGLTRIDSGGGATAYRVGPCRS